MVRICKEATPQPLPNTAKSAMTKIIGNKKKILGPEHGFVYFSLDGQCSQSTRNLLLK